MVEDVGETETATLAEDEVGMGMATDMSRDGGGVKGDGGGMGAKRVLHW